MSLDHEPVQAASFGGPSAASWVDATQRWVERLPWAPALTYVGAWLAVACAVTVVKWRAAAYAPGTVFPYHAVVFGTWIFGLALMHFLDRAAERGLAALRPVLDLSDDEVLGVARRLTTMPTWPALLASLLGVSFGVVQRLSLPAATLALFRYAPSGPLLLVENAVILVLDWGVIGAFVYHVFRQLHIIDRLYRRHAAMDLFNARPLYAFSRFSAQCAVGILAIGYAWIAAYPAEVAPSATRLMLSTIGMLVAIAIAAFLGPIWGAHQGLVRQREQRLQEIHHRLELTVRRLHADIAADDYSAMDGIGKAVTALDAELALVERASTWPWQVSTLRGFLTAILLPLFLWGAQQVLARALLR